MQVSFLFYLLLHVRDNLITSSPPKHIRPLTLLGQGKLSDPVMSAKRLTEVVCGVVAILMTISAVVMATTPAGKTPPQPIQPSQATQDGQIPAAIDPAVMKAALRTATPGEGRFVEHVVRLTRKGTLPVDMVASTFQWARKKPNLRFQYFKWGITARASKIGVTL